MTTAIRLALLGLVLILILGAGVWYYLFGPNTVAAADLIPADTVVFATIPNAAKITAEYQTSLLKQLFDSPDAKPVADSIVNQVGQKNLDLLQAFLPLLSGQSFLALTHFDPNNPAQAGLIAGLKPKPGVGNFNAFVDKLKATYPALLAQGTTGAGHVEGLDYQWIQGPGAPDKICVAQYRGWIITAWGEASLQDWWDRLEKKSATSSLGQKAEYQKSLKRVGLGSEAVLYLDSHALLGMMQARAGSTAQTALLVQKWQGLGTAMVGTQFENGQIADHFSLLMPREAQVTAGILSAPCAFDTLKFTSPDTRFYAARSFNAGQIWKSLQDPSGQMATANPLAAIWLSSLQSWAQSENLDFQHNVIDALGDEASLQVEWSSDSTYPDVGFFVKLAKPDDFKPVVAALLDTVRKNYATTAVVNEINSGDQNFATLKFVQPLPVTPTITEDGPYFGVFLNENQAVRSFQRDASVGLLNDPNFKDQIGNRRSGASQIVFVDTPRFLDRTYQTALPYLSLAAMFNPTLGSLLQNRTMPPNLQWLEPIGSWSCVMSYDDEGLKGYSVSGIGNQGLFLAGGLGGLFSLMPHPGIPPGLSPFATPPVAGPAGTPPLAPASATPPLSNVPAPALITPPATEPMTNAAPETAPPPSPASTNATPAAPAPGQ